MSAETGQKGASKNRSFTYVRSLKKKLANKSLWRTLLFSIFTVYSLIFFSLYQFGTPPPNRQAHYLSPKAMLEEFNIDGDKDKASDRLQKIFESKLAYYQSKLAGFYSTIAFTLVFCVLGIIVLLRDTDIKVPFFSDINVPIDIMYLVIPAYLCYNWMQFGFYLHHIIEARATLFNLTAAQYAIYHPDVISLDGTASIGYEYYYSVTHANDLKDTGFLDSWFLMFQPQWFPTAQLSWSGKIVPVGTMITMALLQGISHGLQLALPLNWIPRFKPKNKKAYIPALVLLLIIIFLVGSSHLGFYYTGRNPNWIQFWILASGILVFWAVTSKEVSNWHKSKSVVQKISESPN